ncbi:MAG: hypothetical protein KKD63_14635 [Proteobacteria bacterium]|nr:hypothetical protein [Pseudomonadota bacterium]
MSDSSPPSSVTSRSERMAVFCSLSIEVKRQITGEEVPDLLLEKLKDYLLPDEG